MSCLHWSQRRQYYYSQTAANRDIVVDIERGGASGIHSSNEIPCAGAISADIEYSLTDTINSNNQIGGKPMDHVMIYSCGEINWSHILSYNIC
jgi:hypothetical protein